MSSSLNVGQTGSGPEALIAYLSGFEAKIGETDVVVGRLDVGLRDLVDEENLDFIIGDDNFVTPFDPYRHYEVMVSR